MSPGRRGGTEESIARTDAGAVQRGDHHHHDGAMRVLHRCRQLARGARGVLEAGEIVRRRRHVVAIRETLDRRHQLVLDDHVETRDVARDRRFLPRGDEQARRAVQHAQAHAVGAEQREQRHRDGAALHRAEQADIERQRRLQHERHAIALGDAARLQPMREARRPRGDLREAQRLVAAVGMGDPHRHAAGGGVAVDALMRDVERRAVAVEQRP